MATLHESLTFNHKFLSSNLNLHEQNRTFILLLQSQGTLWQVWHMNKEVIHATESSEGTNGVKKHEERPIVSNKHKERHDE